MEIVIIALWIVMGIIGYSFAVSKKLSTGACIAWGCACFLFGFIALIPELIILSIIKREEK